MRYLNLISVIVRQLVEIEVVFIYQQILQREELQQHLHDIELLEIERAIKHSQIQNLSRQLQFLLIPKSIRPKKIDLGNSEIFEREEFLGIKFVRVFT